MYDMSLNHIVVYLISVEFAIVNAINKLKANIYIYMVTFDRPQIAEIQARKKKIYMIVY